MSRFQVKGLPWSHGIGTDVSDCKTSREVIEKAKLDFIVDKCELVAKMPFSLHGNNNLGDDAFSYGGSIYRECPNAFATYRTDLNIPLGLVKSKYEVIQNYEAFNFFDDAIGPGKALWQNAGSFGLGHKIFISAKLPMETTVKGDPVDHYLVFSNSHDGSSSINIMFTPVRVFCTNCLNSALKSADSYIRIKHTRTAREKLSTGAEILKIACEYADTATQLYSSLAEIRLSDDAALEYLAKIVLTEDEYATVKNYDKDKGIKKIAYRDYVTMNDTNISTRKANQIHTMFDYYQNADNQRNVVGTAWGAYNAITGYFSSVANTSGEKRMDSILYGGANNVMLKALNKAVLLREVV